MASARTKTTGTTTRVATITTTLGRVETNDILCLEPLGLADHIELDALTLVECLEARTFDRAVVDEYIGTVILCQEAEPLLLGKPLHPASGTSHEHTLTR